MIYLSSFKLSDRTVNNPNIYPYNVFCGKYIEPFVFDKITVFYGNNGSGKSTLLNIIANCLELKGKEYATSNSYGIVDYCGLFSKECSYSLGEDDLGRQFRSLPKNSRYIKSEDILYEIKKIQQRQVLSDGMEYDYVKRGMTISEAKKFLASKEGKKQEEYIMFLEIKGNGLAVYDRKNELKDFHQWDTLVDMRAKHLRYGDVTVLVFSDGVKIKFFEEQWIIETICEKCKQVSMEQYYENKRELKL